MYLAQPGATRAQAGGAHGSAGVQRRAGEAEQRDVEGGEQACVVSQQ